MCLTLIFALKGLELHIVRFLFGLKVILHACLRMQTCVECLADGKLLSLEDVWNAVPDHFQARLKDERWTFVTQQVLWCPTNGSDIVQFLCSVNA